MLSDAEKGAARLRDNPRALAWVNEALGFAAATRQEVYAAIDGERGYQDSLWNASTTETEGKHSVEEFVLYMEHYLQEARRLLSTQASPKARLDGLDFVRKVTAMGVACMEQNGIVCRKVT